MYNRDFTPNWIKQLKENEIFVFGSNLGGMHAGGAARAAMDHYGAVWGQGVGLQGVDVIKPYVDEFVAFARQHPELRFLVTRIGCGIAGFAVEEIAPLFADAIDDENIILPEDFVKVIEQQ